MKSCRVLVAGAVAAIAMAGVARADRASHEAAVREMFGVMNLATNVQSAMEMLVRNQMRQNPHLAPFEDTFREFFAKYMSWEALQNDFLSLYVENFTEQELADLLAFFKTPTGQKTMKMMPTLSQRGAELGQKRVQANIGELQAKLQAEAERLKAMKNAERSKDRLETTPGGLPPAPPPAP